MNIDKTMLINELIIKATRSGGKGGQHVNKVSSRIEVDFHIGNSVLFSPEEKELLLQRLSGRISREGFLKVVSSEDRSQLINKQKAIDKLLHILERNLKVNPVRKATKPSRGSVQERLQEKQRKAQKKAGRQKPAWE